MIAVFMSHLIYDSKPTCKHNVQVEQMHAEMDVKILGRSGGRGAVGAAAYRSETSIVASAAYRAKSGH